MAREDIVPQLLAEIFNRAIPDPLDDNSPLNSFSAPVDGVVLSDTVNAIVSTGPLKYGVGKYAQSTYKQ
jgi:hypothetical protein